MLGRTLSAILRRGNMMMMAQPAFHVPKRNWAQTGMTISTPPRVRVSFGEKMLHGAFMMVVWLGPVLYFLSQVKVWRRLYIEN